MLWQTQMFTKMNMLISLTSDTLPHSDWLCHQLLQPKKFSVTQNSVIQMLHNTGLYL